MKKGRIFGVSLAGITLGLALGWVAPTWAQAPDRPGRRAYLGIMAQPTPENAEHAGVIVREVAPDSPAAKAGLKDGDVIAKVGDKEVKDPAMLANTVAEHKPGDKLALQVWRDGKEQTVTVTVERRPMARALPGIGDIAEGKQHAFLGVQTQTLTPELKDHLGVTADKGVVVTDVVPNSAAAKAGLKQEDVITMVGDQAIANAEELRDTIQKLEIGKEVNLTVMRGRDKMEMKAQLDKAPASLSVLPPEIERRFPEFGRRFATRIPPIFESAERVQELENKVKDLENRIKELEKKLSQQPTK